MLALGAFFSALCVASAFAESLQKRDKSKVPIKPSLFPNLVRYTNFSSAAYVTPCPRPPYGAVVVGYTNITMTDTQATLFRADADSELILAFPGTASNRDLLTDFTFLPVPYTSTGITNCTLCLVHSGFLAAWNSIADPLIAMLDKQKKKHPKYKITVTGHSLGAAIAALAYASLKGLDYNIDAAYTYGQPRVGNPAFADYIDRISGATEKKIGVFFRTTHTFDGVPQLPPTVLGFRHSRTEFWQLDTKSGSQNAQRTYRCYGQEAPDCNASEGRGFINDAHGMYSGIKIGSGASCGR